MPETGVDQRSQYRGWFHRCSGLDQTETIIVDRSPTGPVVLLAVLQQNMPIAEYLIEYKADVSQRVQMHPCGTHAAKFDAPLIFFCDCKEMMITIMESGADIDARSFLNNHRISIEPSI